MKLKSILHGWLRGRADCGLRCGSALGAGAFGLVVNAVAFRRSMRDAPVDELDLVRAHKAKYAAGTATRSLLARLEPGRAVPEDGRSTFPESTRTGYSKETTNE